MKKNSVQILLFIVMSVLILLLSNFFVQGTLQLLIGNINNYMLAIGMNVFANFLSLVIFYFFIIAVEEKYVLSKVQCKMLLGCCVLLYLLPLIWHIITLHKVYVSYIINAVITFFVVNQILNKKMLERKKKDGN